MSKPRRGDRDVHLSFYASVEESNMLQEMQDATGRTATDLLRAGIILLHKHKAQLRVDRPAGTPRGIVLGRTLRLDTLEPVEGEL